MVAVDYMYEQHRAMSQQQMAAANVYTYTTSSGTTACEQATQRPLTWNDVSEHNVKVGKSTPTFAKPKTLRGQLQQEADEWLKDIL